MSMPPLLAAGLRCTSMDPLPIKHTTTAWPAGTLRHGTPQPHRGGHALSAGSRGPPGGRTGLVATRPATAAGQRGPAALGCAAAPASPRYRRCDPYGAGAAHSDAGG